MLNGPFMDNPYMTKVVMDYEHSTTSLLVEGLSCSTNVLMMTTYNRGDCLHEKMMWY